MLREDPGPIIEAHSRRWELIVYTYLGGFVSCPDPAQESQAIERTIVFGWGNIRLIKVPPPVVLKQKLPIVSRQFDAKSSF